MRKVLYVLLLIPLFFVPLNRVDVEKLLPVEAVAIYMDGENVILETDTAHTGIGKNAVEALKNLKKNAAAVIYLDTAEYLLVSADAVLQADSLRPYLKSSVRVCVCDARGAVADTVKYVSVHEKLPKLRSWSAKNYTN